DGSQKPSSHRFLAIIGWAVYSLRPDPSPGLHLAKIDRPPARFGSSSRISIKPYVGRVSAMSTRMVLTSRLATSGRSSVESSRTTVAERGPSSGHRVARSSCGGRAVVLYTEAP